jgi:predicted DCC family thiol-disulfide oxidoreductase YuxK
MAPRPWGFFRLLVLGGANPARPGRFRRGHIIRRMGSLRAALIYDANCPVCRAAADWIRRNAAASDAFEFLPCRSEATRTRFPSIDEDACLQAMHLVLADGTIFAGERAIPEILRRTRRFRWAAMLFRLPGAGILSRVLYRAFASRRHRISCGFFSR